MNVANSTPKASDTAIGTRNAAWMLRSTMSGARPKNVISEVSRIGRKRWLPASRIASCSPLESDARRSVWRPLRARLMKSTMTRLSLTTTPVSATRPNIDIIVTSRPHGISDSFRAGKQGR